MRKAIRTEQIKLEAEYFDKIYGDADARQRSSRYLVPRTLIDEVLNPPSRPLSDRQYAISLLGRLEGKTLLDYGAGDGWNSVCFAKAGATVFAIDISAKGIQLIKKKAIAHDVGDLVIAEVRDCYNTQLDNDTFDVIYGGGILHHLDIDAAGQEINRILHSEGVAVFYEPIRETQAMEIIKRFVFKVTKKQPSEVSESETPLTIRRIKQLNRYFDHVHFRLFNVLTSASLLFKSQWLKPRLFLMDNLFMNYIPFFEKLGMAVVIELRIPKDT